MSRLNYKQKNQEQTIFPVSLTLHSISTATQSPTHFSSFGLNEEIKTCKPLGLEGEQSWNVRTKQQFYRIHKILITQMYLT